jgi:hypothetical protein
MSSLTEKIPAILFDQALVDLVPVRSGALEGHVLAVHGVESDAAQDLPAHVLKAIGVAFPTRIPPQAKGLRRMRLLPGGAVEQA